MTPADSQAQDWEGDSFQLIRSKSFLPKRIDPLKAGNDFNDLVFGRTSTKFFAMISLFSFFIKAIKLARHADVICSHWLLPSGLMGSLIAALFTIPHIAIEHSGALHLLMRLRTGRILARFLIWRSHRIITVSSDLKNKLIALCPEAAGKTEVIPMGVEVSDAGAGLTSGRNLTGDDIPFASQNSDREQPCPYKILYIGRLIEIKGVDVLLKALATLPNIHLLVAGDGEQRKALERLAEKLNVDAVFLGQVGREEKARLFAASDALVIPSRVLADGRTEGMPVVALEALAAGVPVIASGVGGLSEIIRDGQNGLLFEAGNHLLLAEKVKLLLDDRELRQRLSGSGRRRAEAFDWQIIGAKFSDIIKDSLTVNGSVESYQTPSDLKL